MIIQENTLKFSGKFITRELTKRLVVHHSASALNTLIEDIHRWHLGRNWAGIGYHYIIYPNGSIYRGRPEWAKGAHAYQDRYHDGNKDGIGVCLIGDFTIMLPTEAQLTSLVWLTHDIKKRYPDIEVVKHSDVMATECPGLHFPWSSFKKRLEGGPVIEQWKLDIITNAQKEGLITSTNHKPDDVPTKWFVLAVCLNMLKAIRK